MAIDVPTAVDITEPSQRELALRDQLRDAVIGWVEHRNIGPEHLAATLGVPTVIAESLVSRDYPWTLDVAIRVADALGVPWNVTIDDRAD